MDHIPTYHRPREPLVAHLGLGRGKVADVAVCENGSLRLKHMHYRIEIVIGQPVEQFHAKQMWARDAWHNGPWGKA